MKKSEYISILIDTGFLIQGETSELQQKQNDCLNRVVNLLKLLLYDKIRNYQQQIIQISLFKQNIFVQYFISFQYKYLHFNCIPQEQEELELLLKADIPILSHIKQLDEIKSKLQSYDMSHQKTITTPLITLILDLEKNIQFSFRQKKIYFLSQGLSESTADQDQQQQLKAVIKKHNLKINIIGFSSLENDDDKEYLNRQQNQQILLELQNSLKNNVKLFTCDEAFQILRQFGPKQIQNRAKYKGLFQITSDLHANIIIYTKSLERKCPIQFKEDGKVFVYSLVEDNPQENENNIELFKDQQIEQSEEELNIKKFEFVKAFYYGKELVRISDVMLQQTKLNTISCLIVLGTVKARLIPRQSYMRGTDVVYPQNDTKSRKIFSSLVYSLKELNKYFICRYVPRTNSIPRLVVLIPCLASKYECFYLNELPTTESVREYPFNPLKKSTEKQQQVMSELIDSLDMDKNNIQFDLKQLNNPYYQALNYYVYQKQKKQLIKISESNNNNNEDEFNQESKNEQFFQRGLFYLLINDCILNRQIKANSIEYLRQNVSIENQYSENTKNRVVQICQEIQQTCQLEINIDYENSQNKIFWQELNKVHQKINQSDKESEYLIKQLQFENLINKKYSNVEEFLEKNYKIKFQDIPQDNQNQITQLFQDLENSESDSNKSEQIKLQFNSIQQFLTQFQENLYTQKVESDQIANQNNIDDTQQNCQPELDLQYLFTTEQSKLHIKYISLSNPIRDFEYLIKRASSTQNKLKIIDEFIQVIEEIIDLSIKGNYFNQAKDCIIELQAACSQLEIKNIFKSFVQELYDLYNQFGQNGFFAFFKEYLRTIIQNDYQYSDLEVFLLEENKYLPSDTDDEDNRDKRKIQREFDVNIDDILNEQIESANSSSCESFIEDILNPNLEQEEFQQKMESTEEFIKCYDPLAMNKNLLQIDLEYKPPEVNFTLKQSIYFRCIQQLIGLDECKTPKDFFEKIWDDQVWEMLTLFSNLYAEQYFQKQGIKMDSTFMDQIKEEKQLFQLLKHFTPFTKNEMKRFIICEILQGIKRLPCFLDYWSTNPLVSGGLNRIMSKMKYNICVMFLHASDNSDTKLKRHEIGKIKQLQKILNINFSKYYKHSNFLSIDEGVIPFKGKSHLKVYCPGKPYKYGIKEFLLCDFTGYTLIQKIATTRDKENVYKKDAANTKKYTHLLVKQLIKYQRNLDQKIIFMDNFYSSIPLFQELSEKNIGVVGTIRQDRLKLTSQQRNEIKKTVLKENESISYLKKNLHLLIWKDNKRVVKIMSNCIGMKSIKSQSVKNTTKQIPLMVKLYNKCSHSVDKRNQLLQYYRTIRRTRKWWKTIFYRLLETSITNSYILYKLKFQENIAQDYSILTHKEFRLRLITEISQEINKNLLQEVNQEQESTQDQFQVTVKKDAPNIEVSYNSSGNTSTLQATFSTTFNQDQQSKEMTQNVYHNLTDIPSLQNQEMEINDSLSDNILQSYQEIKEEYLTVWDEQKRHRFNLEKIKQLGINPLNNQKIISLERSIECKKQDIFNTKNQYEFKHFVINNKVKDNCFICKKITKFGCDTCFHFSSKYNLPLCPGECQKTHMLSFFKKTKMLSQENSKANQVSVQNDSDIQCLQFDKSAENNSSQIKIEEQDYKLIIQEESIDEELFEQTDNNKSQTVKELINLDSFSQLLSKFKQKCVYQKDVYSNLKESKDKQDLSSTQMKMNSQQMIFKQKKLDKKIYQINNKKSKYFLNKFQNLNDNHQLQQQIPKIADEKQIKLKMEYCTKPKQKVQLDDSLFEKFDDNLDKIEIDDTLFEQKDYSTDKKEQHVFIDENLFELKQDINIKTKGEFIFEKQQEQSLLFQKKEEIYQDQETYSIEKS